MPAIDREDRRWQSCLPIWRQPLGFAFPIQLRPLPAIPFVWNQVAFVTPARWRLPGRGTMLHSLPRRELFLSIRPQANWPGFAAFRRNSYAANRKERSAIAIGHLDCWPSNPAWLVGPTKVSREMKAGQKHSSSI